MLFTTERTINGKEFEGVIETMPNETDVYAVYVKRLGENERGENLYYFYGPERTIESEERIGAPLAGTPGFSNDETREYLDGLFESIN